MRRPGGGEREKRARRGREQTCRESLVLKSVKDLCLKSARESFVSEREEGGTRSEADVLRVARARKRT